MPDLGEPRDEPGIGHEPAPAASTAHDDFANGGGVLGQGDGREVGPVHLQEGQVGKRHSFAASDPGSHVARGRLHPNLLISVEQVIRDDDGVRVDDRAAGGAPAPAACEHDACRGRGHCGGQIAGELLCKEFRHESRIAGAGGREISRTTR